MTRIAAVFVALALAACGAPSPGADAGPLVDGGSDTGTDAGADAGPRSCADAIPDAFAIDPAGPTTQIHAAAAWDGEGVWVVYDRPEPGGTGLFDVHAVRLGCDGTPSIPIFAVQDVSAGNDVDPSIAIVGSRLFVAWNVDDGTGGTSNLQVRYRLFALDGTPIAGQRTLVTMRGGAPITENHLGVDLDVTSDGVVIAGGRALPDVMRIQAYAQRVDLAGALVGEALEGTAEPMVSHRSVAVAALASDVWLAYDHEPDVGSTDVHVRRIGDASGLALGGLASSGGADLLARGGHVWAALAGELPTGEVDLRVLDVSLPLAERMAAVVGEPGRLEHTPRLAASPSGALAIAWYRNLSGIRNELYAASIDVTGAVPVVHAPVLVRGDPGAAPYAPALTHVVDDVWFLAWSEGTSPDLRLEGRFVTLP